MRYEKRDMSDVRTKETLRNLGTYVIMVFENIYQIQKKNIYIYIYIYTYRFGLLHPFFFLFFFLQIWNQDRNPRILNRGPIRTNPSENQIKLDF